MAVVDLERQIRRGLLGPMKVFRKNDTTFRGFLKLYPERFTTRSGYVTIKDAVAEGPPSPVEPATPAPPAPPAPPPDLLPETPRSNSFHLPCVFA